MKKIASVLLAAAMVLCLGCAAFAETVAVDDYDLSFEIPDGWSILSDGSKVSTDVLDEFGLTQEEAEEMLEGVNASCIAYSVELGAEVAVTVLPSEADNINLFTSDDMNGLGKSFESELENTGVDFESYSFYYTEGLKYLVLKYSYEDSNGTIFCAQYFTILNSGYINIVYRSYYDELGSADYKAVNSIADSLISTRSKSAASASSSSSRTSSSAAENTTSGSFGSGLGSKVLIAGIIGGLFGLFVCIKNAIKKKSENKTQEAPEPEANAAETEAPALETENEPDRCAKCGGAITPEDDFCPLCGEKVVR